MLYDLRNASRATRIVYDSRGSEVRLKEGEERHGVDLPLELAQALFRAPSELEISEHRPGGRPRLNGAVAITGMYGIGDALHQRAIMRELMKREQVWLSTCHWHIYHDLIEQGLHITFQPTRLRAQAKTIAREKGLFKPVPAPPTDAHHIKLWYKKPAIDRYGSILQAMAGAVSEQGHPVDPAKPLDFSLPIPASWQAPKWDTGGKPLLVYRPVVLRREWNSANRNPDPHAYEKLFEVAREGYFVVSLADLQPGEEWIVGGEPSADVKLHGGELAFEQMAALFRSANLVFCNAGFAPVLAQAVGTPSICIYGGRESYGTTQRAGAHLAPTLGIDPIHPCDCHTEAHNCGDKAIDLPPALDRVREFAKTYSKPKLISGMETATAQGGTAVARLASRPLIFATTYVDSPDRQKLTEQWVRLHTALNPDCDFLIIDSKSPLPLPGGVEVFQFGDNIGHLSRNGADGWGRAFCKGLDLACERGYEHVVHIEGDSLLRTPVRDLVAHLKASGKGCATTPVTGTERVMPGWVETGLMVFSTEFLRKKQIAQAYDWPRRTARPTPELVLRAVVGEENIASLPIKAQRGDKHQINHDNILSLDLDWVTHCHGDIWVYDRFVEANMPPPPLAGQDGFAAEPIADNSRQMPTLRLNLGCGDNRLDGWANHDAEVDITKRLPWPDDSAAVLFIEHCVEHVSYHQAVRFFEEARRVLAPGGVLRVTVPSIEQIAATSDASYFAFTAKFGGEPTRHGALASIIFNHGHQCAWTASLMRCTLDYAGFADIRAYPVGVSDHPALVGVEGHGKMIGATYNLIESMCFEGVKPGGVAFQQPVPRNEQRNENKPERTGNRDGQARTLVAVVVGGATGVEDEIERTRRLLDGRPATWFVVNDMIPTFPDSCEAATLHPNKAKDWLTQRMKNRLPPPTRVWAHSLGTKARPWPGVTDVCDDARGSSGLFAVMVARRLNYDRIILCGVPMDGAAGHFKRGPADWTACQSFLIAWEHRRKVLEPFLRSWSGWTKTAFGEPSAAFLGALEAAA